MASALNGSASCARCAHAAAPDATRCDACGAVLEAPASGSAVTSRAGVLRGVTLATAGRRRLAVAVDLALLIAVAALAVAAASALLPLSLAWIAAPAAALLVLAAATATLRRSGTTAGRAVLRLRTVDNLTATPPVRASALAAALVVARGRTTVTADLRRGRDPLRAALAPFVLAPAAVQAPLPQDEERPSLVPLPEPVARLVFDSGDELEVTAPVLIGRQPEPTGGVRAVHALPDLSRSLARTHALLEVAGGLLWVTDLGSANGSAITDRDGVSQPLVAGLRTAAAVGWTVRLGGRSLEVHAGRAAASAGRTTDGR